MKYSLILFEIILIALIAYNSIVNDGNLLMNSIFFILANILAAIIVKNTF